MSPLFVTLMTLTAAAPAPSKAGPRGPTDFDLAVYLPRYERGAELTEFARTGSARTVLLRAESWRDELHPLLHLDLTRPEEAAAAGIDITAPFTVVNKNGIRVSCAVISDLKTYETRCGDKLNIAGEPHNYVFNGARLVSRKDALGRVPSGYVVKGNESCAAVGGGLSVEAALKEATNWLGRPATGALWGMTKELPGSLYVVRKEGTISVRADGLTLTVEAKGKTPPGVGQPGGSPYAKVPPTGLLTLRLRAVPGALRPGLEMLAKELAEMCPACEKPAFAQAAAALAPTLSGNVVVMVQKVKVSSSLKTAAGRFFAPKTAVLAETDKPEEAKAALMSLASQKGAKATTSGDGLSLLVREGEVRFGVRDRHVFVTNDAAALEALWNSVKDTAGTQAHAAELSVDPRLLAAGLSQVPLMDAVSSQELAGVLAAGTELGPLLMATDRLTAWADAAGANHSRAQLVFRLKPAPAPVDAGTLPPAVPSE